MMLVIHYFLPSTIPQPSGSNIIPNMSSVPKRNLLQTPKFTAMPPAPLPSTYINSVFDRYFTAPLYMA